MPSVFPGLCADCASSRVIDTGRSTFYLCLRAQTDPQYLKYPPLPVLACPGYEGKGPPAPPVICKPGDKLS